MNFEHEVILCIVNNGFSEAVMDAAREAGARGGTVIHARGTANKDAELFFNISIQPEKEVVMILAAFSSSLKYVHFLQFHAQPYSSFLSKPYSNNGDMPHEDQKRD